MYPPDMLWELARQNRDTMLRLAAIDHQLADAARPVPITPPIVVHATAPVPDRLWRQIEAILRGTGATMGANQGDTPMTAAPIIAARGLAKRFGTFTAVNGI